jgi:hypothetical protein
MSAIRISGSIYRLIEVGSLLWDKFGWCTPTDIICILYIFYINHVLSHSGKEKLYISLEQERGIELVVSSKTMNQLIDIIDYIFICKHF